MSDDTGYNIKISKKIPLYIFTGLAIGILFLLIFANTSKASYYEGYNDGYKKGLAQGEKDDQFISNSRAKIWNLDEEGWHIVKIRDRKESFIGPIGDVVKMSNGTLYFIKDDKVWFRD